MIFSKTGGLINISPLWSEWFRSSFLHFLLLFVVVQVCKKGLFKDFPRGTAVHLSVQITLILTLNQNFILFTSRVWFRGQFKGRHCSQVHLIWIRRLSFVMQQRQKDKKTNKNTFVKKHLNCVLKNIDVCNNWVLNSNFLTILMNIADTPSQIPNASYNSIYTPHPTNTPSTPSK